MFTVNLPKIMYTKKRPGLALPVRKRVSSVYERTELKEKKPEQNSKEIVLKDRRSMQRYDLPDAGIELILHGVPHKNILLVELSFNSVRIITSLKLIEEQDVMVHLKNAGSKELFLKGFVLRIDDFPGKKAKYIVAIKFHPFSTYERYNDLEDRRYLKEILDKAKSA